jgi:hypothetical protein
MAAKASEFESFLKSLNFAEEYLQRFVQAGFDDLDLIKSLEPEELQHMFDLVGLSAKPGHVLKFKKAVVSSNNLKSSMQQGGTVPQGSITQRMVQKSKFCDD